MSKTVDARGFSCPEPVLHARRAIQHLAAGGAVEVLVDSEVARENVTRMARSMGCAVESVAGEDGVTVKINKP